MARFGTKIQKVCAYVLNQWLRHLSVFKACMIYHNISIECRVGKLEYRSKRTAGCDLKYTIAAVAESCCRREGSLYTVLQKFYTLKRRPYKFLPALTVYPLHPSTNYKTIDQSKFSTPLLFERSVEGWNFHCTIVKRCTKTEETWIIFAY